MADLSNKKIGNSYGDLVTIDADPSNSGINSGLQNICDGNNAKSPLSLSLTKAQVKPSSNSADTFEVQNASGDSCFSVSTSNKIVTAGSNDVNVLKRQEIFGWHGTYGDLTDDTWYSMYHGSIPEGLYGNKWGTGSDPDSTNGADIAENTANGGHYENINAFHLFNHITITRVRIHYVGRYISNTTYPVFKCQLWRFDSNDSFAGTAGGHSDGVKLASHTGSLTASGFEIKKDLSIDTADVNHNDNMTVLIPLVRIETIGNVDLMVKMYINYYIR